MAFYIWFDIQSDCMHLLLPTVASII